MDVVVCVWLNQREEETRKLKDLASFKAQFPNVLASKPFAPAKSSRPLTGMFFVPAVFNHRLTNVFLLAGPLYRQSLYGV